MELSTGLDWSEFAATLMHSRRNVLPRHMVEPGPDEAQLQAILGAASAAPDHRQLHPWRFVLVPAHQRVRLAEAFGLALQERDASAQPEQLAQAREKAHRAPCLLLAVARLSESGAHGPLEHEVNDAQRLVSLGCAIQNILLYAHASGFATGLTSGQALASAPLRALFGLAQHEQAVCCINIGSASHRPNARPRPALGDYVSILG